MVLVGLFWIVHFVGAELEMPYFLRFLLSMAAPGLLALLYFGWWWALRRIRLADRLYGFVLILGAGVLVEPLCHKSIGWFGLAMGGLPIVLTIWTLWMLLVYKTSLTWTRLGSLAIVVLTWACFTVIRKDGLNSDLQGKTHWRWTPTAEETFLAQKAKAFKNGSELSLSAEWSPSLTPGDWTGFRGPNRDGVLRGVAIATDWNTAPPKQLWRKMVGPAWSSVTVIGNRLFTQEQWGKQEAVVCYDASTGDEIWAHEDAVRFEEGVSGPGPRATPTYADGRVFTLGATGILNCLDAATGKRHWSRDIAAEAPAKVPMWGFASSPLVATGLVIVFAGGESDQNLMAYDVESGERAWTARAGLGSYSSPELATIAGKLQCLIYSDGGLTAVDPATGTVLWKHGEGMPGAPATLQPHVIGESQLLVHTLVGVSSAVAMLDVSRQGDAWEVKESWRSRDLKPEFPDLVVHEGHAYGFDGAYFCCIDLAKGKRSWKGGRYGRGQVMLLAEQGLLLVISEAGEAILLAANPERQEILGRLQALKGTTWNHPVIAHGRLYVRNDEEMACYELESR
jgi:outer membrane protein assembly factor BamB